MFATFLKKRLSKGKENTLKIKNKHIFCDIIYYFKKITVLPQVRKIILIKLEMNVNWIQTIVYELLRERKN